MIILFILILVLGVAFVMIASGWKVYTKAGKPGWASLVPIYNDIVLLEIIGKPTWWIVMFYFVPFANIVFRIMAINLLCKSFGKDTGFTIGVILLPIVFWPLLGFGDAKYQGPAGLPGSQAQPQQL